MLAVALWTLLPLALLHYGAWKRWRALWRFQLLLDLVLASVCLLAIVGGRDLNPIRCVQRIPPYTAWHWSEHTQLQPTQSDLVLQFHPWWAEARRLLSGGEPPFISERLAGTPLLANGQTGVLAPMMAPVWALGPERGTTVMAMYKLEAAAVGAFLVLLCTVRLRWAAAAVGGIAYGCSAYQVAWLLVPLSWATAALPWLWWGVMWCLRRRASWRSVVVVGGVSGWLLGSGLHPETAAIALGSSWLAGLVLHPRRWSRVVLLAAVALPTAAALSWPTIGYIGGSAKAAALTEGRPNLERLPAVVQHAALQQLLLPSVRGRPNSGDWNAPYPYAPAATSVGGCALALVAAGGVRRRRRSLVLAACACLGVAAVLAYRIPPLDWVLVRMPPFDRMTLPRFAALVPWGLAVCAAVAAQGALEGRVRRITWRLVPLAALLGALVWAAPWHRAASSQLLVMLTVATAAAVVLAPRWVRLAPLVIACELAALAWGINPTAAASDRLPTPPLLQHLGERAAEEGGRVLGLGGAMAPNMVSRLGLTQLQIFDPVRPLPLSRLLRLLGEQDLVLGGELTTAPPRLCGAYCVRFLLTPPGTAVEGWQREWSDDSGTLWHNPWWLPEVRLVGRVKVASSGLQEQLLMSEEVDFATTAVVDAVPSEVGADSLDIEELQVGATSISVMTSCDGPALLVVARPWAPGWRARVDGQRVPVTRTNLAGMGVAVPQGRHRAELSYHPWAWAW